MRIINWNCCRGQHRDKLPSLLGLAPSVAVIQETPRPTTTVASSQVWHGVNPQHGMMVIGSAEWRVEKGASFRKEPQLYLPATVVGRREHFNILAVWAKPGGKGSSYTSSLVDGINHYARFIVSAPTIVIGDFNVPDLFYDLQSSFGLLSAYHAFFGAALGSEQHATHYWRWDESRRFHLDYCFIPKAWRRRLQSVTIGEYGPWTGKRLSDHTPVVVDIRDRR
jgi:exodeoxyribonuclease III